MILFRINCNSDIIGNGMGKPNREKKKEAKTFWKKSGALKNLKKNLERDTFLQSGSDKRLKYYRNLLTASNYHNVCIERPTSYKNLLKKLFYVTELHVPGISHGLNN